MKSRIINVNFKPIEFDRFRNQAGLNSFALSPKKWIEATGAIGLYAKAVRDDPRKPAPMFCLMFSPAKTDGQLCH
jgi:hypothetical protein